MASVSSKMLSDTGLHQSASNWPKFPVLCQNSALLKQTINQQRSVCVCDRTKGRRLYDRLVSKNTNKLKTRNSKNL